MTLLDLNGIAQFSATQILYCLLEGTLIAVLVALALRARRQDARTNFAVWFAALLGIAALPFAEGFLSGKARGSAAASSVLTVPASWAVDLFCAWAAIA